MRGSWEVSSRDPRVSPSQARHTRHQVRDEGRRVIQVQHDFWVLRSDKVLDCRKIEHGPKRARAQACPGLSWKAMLHAFLPGCD